MITLVERVSHELLDYPVATLSLLPDDHHSLEQEALPQYTDGHPVFSCERWCRLRLDPPYGAITNIRFWLNNFDPTQGWMINYGLSLTYRSPTRGASRLAVYPVPIVTPVSVNLTPGPLTGLAYSPWLVIQAISTDEAAVGTLTGVTVEFTWDES